jgi:hypothetical protein
MAGEQIDMFKPINITEPREKVNEKSVAFARRNGYIFIHIISLVHPP